MQKMQGQKPTLEETRNSKVKKLSSFILNSIAENVSSRTSNVKPKGLTK
jgi:hypothetical protein